ncbi:TPA: SDR family oxidoreductase [Candidatus Saccharibacteria bacterium]|nr:MAG: short-chain dehydrogenase/reductase SDR, 3-oxoacyl-[acyl-carrier protein] reductase [Candidatus Saccharibacteria bacterium GW2011_GWC2_44_17]MBH1956135.1 SDR family oxidoreductase [Candidatus Saccharibacteria bacterium]MBH1972523.1 SDR family oxidoreductase [Candidatus Saccharibacteria bacterium]MBH1990725.1 SDR family oxidoreductase [Candidatus Saccharibacteria bacterium]HBH77594.1 SDR family oxidoreductase [Candidatus Saccharibacteria bacterium]
MNEILGLDTLLNLSGKTAFVTGSAGGIGEAAARRLHEAGANVVVTDINRDGARLVAESLNSIRSDSALAVSLDISEGIQVEEALRRSLEQFDGVDILVNNAGIFPFSPLADMTEPDFIRVIDVNLRGVFLCTKFFTEHMKQRGRGGKVVNITSIDAIHPSMVGLAHYDASKHGVWGFTKNIAIELAAHNITVNAIAPGGIATPGTGAKDGVPAPGNEAFIERIPMRRMGQSDEIAKVVLFLASDMSSYMTGSQVVVDGGRLQM